MPDRPAVIGITCCHRDLNGHRYHMVAALYVEAVSVGAGGLPWLIAATGKAWPPEALLDRLDGLLVTGSRSNVHPGLYHNDPESIACGPYDTDRDATTLPLIRGALDRRLPLLAICRGLQELNVALGGTLHPRVHEVPGKMDHRDPPDTPHEVMYAPVHPVRLREGGILARLARGAGLTDTAAVPVNSLHGQGIDCLGQGLVVEATAPDGLVEAISVDTQDDSFAVGVQWHPEWRFADNPLSAALLRAFGDAARARASQPG